MCGINTVKQNHNVCFQLLWYQTKEFTNNAEILLIFSEKIKIYEEFDTFI